MRHTFSFAQNPTTVPKKVTAIKAAVLQRRLHEAPHGTAALTADLCNDTLEADSQVAPQADELLQFESLLAELSATFVNLPANQVDSRIETALRRVVEFLGVDRGGLAEILSKPNQIVITHSYQAPGAPALPRLILDQQLPWYAETIRRGEALRLATIPDDLPPEAAAEREFCNKDRMKSHVMIPLMVTGSVVGAIGFTSFSSHRDWPDDLIQRLRLVGEIFTNALIRKQADTVIHESEERFRLMAEAAPVMVWMSGPDKLCTYFNKHWLNFTGRTLDREIGNGWSEGVHPDDLQRCLQTFCEAFDARQEFRMEYRLKRFDGEYRWILDTGAPRLATDGTFEGYIGSCIDVTDQKRVEEALRLSHEGLRDLAAKLIRAQEEERRRIAREMHDDWTQRLAVLAIDITKLERQLGLSPPGRSQLQGIREALVRLSEDVHDLSRSLHPSILDDLGLVEALRSECASFARREGIAVDYRPGAVPATLPKDVAMCLYRVAQEALRNIGRHAFPDAASKRTASVSLAISGGSAAAATSNCAELVLRVEDNGDGFDPKTKRSQPGLGLASMEERVRLIGAKVSVTSAPGNGTTVIVRAPLSASS